MALKDVSVLIVDDMSTMCRVLAEICRGAGISKIDLAQSGHEAWEKLKKPEAQYNLLLVDHSMPGMTGLELLARMRQDETLRQTKVIMITAESEKETLLQALELDVKGFITKPFAAPKVAEKIMSVMS
jgi:two-component system chemotaxis response regulator CheY